MPLETATYITSLVITNPDGSDQKNTADDHTRLIKACLKRTFPLLDGPVSLSHTQLMLLDGLSAGVQVQFNNLRDGSATVYNALYANSTSFATNANNALSLGGLAAAVYMRKDAFQTISARVTLHNSGPEMLRLAGNAHNHISWYNSAQDTRYGYVQMVVGGDLTIANEQGSGLGIALLGARLTFNSNTVWHSANDGALSGLDADLLDGFQSSINADSNTIGLRNASGHFFAVYFNTSAPVSENPNVAAVCVNSGDGYIRHATPAYLGTQMQARNITGKGGTAKTLSSSLPSGGVDGDIWYRT